MKKILATVFLSVIVLLKASADEGMWLPLVLGQQVYNDMVKKGLKLTKDQIYNINKASIKDAIIIFGGGCTGVVVSPEGLIFTNYHCGYDVIAGASAADHNYLKNGFYARYKNDEIPSSLTVQFLLRVEDVTKEVSDALNGLSGSERLQKQSTVLAAINKRMSDTTQKIETRVSSLFKGNQFLAFVYQRYTDVRLVGTPPETVGKFGGDTDNWMWPRHTGDFVIFRVYANTENNPTSYSASNVPYKPKSFLPISIKGFKEGEYTMVMGYPGNTNRYETSYGVALASEINDPSIAKLLNLRLRYMMEEMKKDPAVDLQLGPSYAVLANSAKFFEGEGKQLMKYDVYDQKKAFEDKFIAWSKGKPEYQGIFTGWNNTYNEWRKYAKQRVYVLQGILGSPLMYFVSMSMIPFETALVKTGVSQAELKRIRSMAIEARKELISRENKTSDQNIVAMTMMAFYTDVDKDQHPIGFYGTLKNKYGPLNDEATYRKFAAEIFSKTMFFDDAKWEAFLAHPDASVLQSDPAFNYVSAFYTNNYISKYSSIYQQFAAQNADYGRLYIKGIMEMDTVKARFMYPDATFTMRLSYGAVKPYRPRDATYYDYLTTAKGVLEKYKPGDYEFDLQASQIGLFRKKDFGQYIDKQRNDLVIAFITTNDITGGNSGSPVLNGKGELIGLAFDGNYEAMGHKMAYDKDLNRTINVDIRYILWCIDKLGGASNIIKELKIIK